MSAPFSLYYEDHIEVKVIARNAVGESPPSEARSKEVLIPYISSQLEFGKSNY